MLSPCWLKTSFHFWKFWVPFISQKPWVGRPFKLDPIWGMITEWLAVYLSILGIRHHVHVLTRICLYAEVGTCSSFTPNSITNNAWNFEYNVHNIYVDGNTNSIFYATLVVVLYNSIRTYTSSKYVILDLILVSVAE